MSAPPLARPQSGPSRPYRFPAFERTTLPNGIELLIAPVKRLPLVTIRFVLDVGARQEPRADAGVATLTAAALAEGTARLNAAALADEFERLGGSLSSYATWDATHVRTSVLSNRLREALSLLSEVVRTPAFEPREVNRLKEERLAELLELKSEPRGLADERFTSSLYRGDSRLSVQEGGSERTVTRLTVDACRAWHALQFSPSVTALVLAGDVDVDDALGIAMENLGDWVAAEPAPAIVDDTPSRDYRNVRLLDRPGAPQTELRLGHVGLPRLHPDYFDVVVMNAILGGVFNSRINLNLRERNAFTYGAFSSFEWRRDAGPFVVSTAVATPVTASAIRETIAELDRMRSTMPSVDELSLSTSYLDGVFPIRFETTDAIAGALASLRTLRLPNNFYDTYRERVRSVTADDVARAAREHLHLERLQVLAVGDRAQVAPMLADLELGPLSVIGDVDE
jgi:zinc protease